MADQAVPVLGIGGADAAPDGAVAGSPNRRADQAKVILTLFLAVALWWQVIIPFFEACLREFPTDMVWLDRLIRAADWSAGVKGPVAVAEIILVVFSFIVSPWIGRWLWWFAFVTGLLGVVSALFLQIWLHTAPPLIESFDNFDYVSQVIAAKEEQALAADTVVDIAAVQSELKSKMVPVLGFYIGICAMLLTAMARGRVDLSPLRKLLRM